MDDEPSFATNAGNTTRPKPNTQKKAEVNSDEQKLTVVILTNQSIILFVHSSFNTNKIKSEFN